VSSSVLGTAREGLGPSAQALLAAAARARGLEVRVWRRAGQGWVCLWGEAEAPDAGAVPVGPDHALEVLGGTPGDAELLAEALRLVLQHEAELRALSHEIAERYEEITLLYTISEILGSTLALEDAAQQILAELVATLDAQEAGLWVPDPGAEALVRIAGVGREWAENRVILTSEALPARVFRERRPVVLGPGERDGVAAGPFLSVPIVFTPPWAEPRPVGVLQLAGRPRGAAFSAGDLKMLLAVASQIGAALENRRLVRESLHRERLLRELELAHDLQLKLLPRPAWVENGFQVAARCRPAESVGGDFYHFVPLRGERLGVVVGDVSGHGFGAALIMALTLSAVSIHASEGHRPSEVLRRVRRALAAELTQTEMHLSLCYVVLDPRRRRLVYANAGHPHAFLLEGDGAVHRLGALAPPLGMGSEETFAERRQVWHPGRDLLLLFTDGLARSLGPSERQGEAVLLARAWARRSEPVQAVLDGLWDWTAGTPEDDCTAVVARA